MFEVKNCGDEPDKNVMGIRFLLVGAQFAISIYSFIYTQSWPLFIFWLATLLLFLTIPRKLICARCEGGYGKKCYPLYLGLYTSKVFSYEDKDVPLIGGILEGFCLLVLPLLPLIPLYQNLVLFIIYLVLLTVNLLFQFYHACRYCAICADEPWKKKCPAHRLARKKL